MQIASIVILTPGGGFDIVLTKVISCCRSVFRAAIAAFIAGMATASFSSHSFLIVCALSAAKNQKNIQSDGRVDSTIKYESGQTASLIDV